MKHLILILVLLLGGYAAWHLTKPKVRRKYLRLARPHVIAVLVIVAFVAAGLVAFFHLPSIRIL